MAAAGSDDYCTRIVHDLDQVGASAWNDLLGRGAHGNPFLSYEFLQALHATGCASLRTGWEPHYLTLWKSGVLCGAVPLYRKHHSYGEYVFDWAWRMRISAMASRTTRSGWPRAVHSGARRAAAGGGRRDRERLARALVEHAAASTLSSLHVLFPTEDEALTLQALGALTRHSVQFHWFNRAMRRSTITLRSSRSPSARRCAPSAARW